MHLTKVVECLLCARPCSTHSVVGGQYNKAPALVEFTLQHIRPTILTIILSVEGMTCPVVVDVIKHQDKVTMVEEGPFKWDGQRRPLWERVTWSRALIEGP